MAARRRTHVGVAAAFVEMSHGFQLPLKKGSVGQEAETCEVALPRFCHGWARCIWTTTGGFHSPSTIS
jgi:hypothetical protein